MGYFLMATTGQFKLANKLISVIHKHPQGIHKFDLMDDPFVKISISTYEKLKPWFEHRYETSVRYDKKSQKWYPIQSIKVEQETE
jgi:hypothetical protein